MGDDNRIGTHDAAYRKAEHKIEEALRTGATHLDLSNNQLTALPESIGKLTQLLRLDLDDNQLTALPESLGQLTDLQTVFLNNNQLTALPEALGKLTNLWQIILSYNQLTALPEALGKLTNLTALSLRNNQLTALPEALGKLTNLRQLSLSDNQLTALPEALGKLANLTDLYLSNNQLTALPEALGKLTNLTELDLSDNQLTALPEALRQLSHLEKLYLHNNPDLGIPPEILGPTWLDVIGNEAQPAAPQSILEYYFHIHPPEDRAVASGITSRPLNEAKVILVGPGEAGKTSVVNRLVKNKFNAKESTTHGIRITQWKLAVQRDEIRLNLWDFGGQDIQHATHQFFLTERSLYLVVLDGRKGCEDEDAEYWLKFIKAFGGKSAAIVVLNKQRQHSYDVNKTALLEKYPFIRAFIPTDCKPQTRNGIPKLKKEIQGALADMPEVRIPFPAHWFGIKERLAVLKTPFMPFAEYRKVCQELKESDKDSQDQLAYYLNCLGIALNFRKDPRLRETSVLKPQWITKGVYRIITSRKLSRSLGELRYSDLSHILPAKDYPETMYTFLLDLMRKFEVCFEFDDARAERRFLVPELLGKQKPNLMGEFALGQCLNFRYQYRLLPDGLLPRFIVRTHVMSEGHEQRWRTGVVLSWEGCRALVEVDKAERHVLIRVNGNRERRRRLLAVIRANFEHIHYEMKGEFKPTEWIALEDHPQDWVDYADLEVHAREGKPTYDKRIGEKLVPLNPEKLLLETDVGDTTRSHSKRNIFDSEAWEDNRVKLFISYSHKDDKWRDTLKSNLEILEREKLIEVWYDQRIEAGTEWDDTIKQKLEEAEIILFLVSTDLLASKYVRDVELPMALEQYQAKRSRLLPVIVRACNVKHTPLGKLQALPNGGRPLKGRRDRDEACMEVENGIRAAVEDIRRTKPAKRL